MDPTNQTRELIELLTRQIRQAEVDVEAVKAKNSELTESLASAQKQVAELNKKLTDTQNSNTALSIEGNGLKRTLETMSDTIAVDEGMNNMLKTEAEKMRADINEANTKYEETRQKIQSEVEVIAGLKPELLQEQKNLESTIQQLGTLVEERSSLAANLDTLSQNAATAASDLQKHKFEHLVNSCHEFLIRGLLDIPKGTQHFDPVELILSYQAIRSSKLKNPAQDWLKCISGLFQEQSQPISCQSLVVKACLDEKITMQDLAAMASYLLHLEDVALPVSMTLCMAILKILTRQVVSVEVVDKSLALVWLRCAELIGRSLASGSKLLESLFNEVYDNVDRALRGSSLGESLLLWLKNAIQNDTADLVTCLKQQVDLRLRFDGGLIFAETAITTKNAVLLVHDENPGIRLLLPGSFRWSREHSMYCMMVKGSNGVESCLARWPFRSGTTALFDVLGSYSYLKEYPAEESAFSVQ